jgi:GDPmannose 4,6-dehydratase
MIRSAVIGSAGQDGGILCRYLAEKGQKVIPVRRGDLNLCNATEVDRFLSNESPDHIYYLPAFHHSSEDRNHPPVAEIFTRSIEVHQMGAVAFLDAIASRHKGKRFFYAASSHVFGEPDHSPQNESTPFNPINIYGITKAAGVESCRYYRKNHGVYAVCGILYNHESEWRSPRFVSQKIVRAAVAISKGSQEKLRLGNLHAKADWGYAPDFIEAMELVMNSPEPSDYIIATGSTHTVQQFVEMAFSSLVLDWSEHVIVDERLVARYEGAVLSGDISKLRDMTGWVPRTSLKEMISIMINAAINE